MKVDALSLKLNKFANNILGMYFPMNSIPNKMMNATVRYWMQQNWYKVTPIIEQFADKNGEIDVDELFRCYESALFDENNNLTIDVQKLIPPKYEWAKSLVPSKTVILTKDDFRNMLGSTQTRIQSAMAQSSSSAQQFKYDVV